LFATFITSYVIIDKKCGYVDKDKSVDNFVKISTKSKKNMKIFLNEHNYVVDNPIKIIYCENNEFVTFFPSQHKNYETEIIQRINTSNCELCHNK
jgi:hypothetical protein